eukprot:m.18983 g.18983  ORF g.18983 m.18983 type:complete len:288 (-) comp10877_c0_seq1:889-1752(-)
MAQASHTHAYGCMTSGALHFSHAHFAQAAEKYSEAAAHFTTLSEAQTVELTQQKYLSEANSARQLAVILRHSQTVQDGPVHDLLAEAVAESNLPITEGPNALIQQLQSLAEENNNLRNQLEETRRSLAILRQGVDQMTSAPTSPAMPPHDRVAILQRALQEHNPELLRVRCHVASLLHEQGLLQRWAVERQVSANAVDPGSHHGDELNTPGTAPSTAAHAEATRAEADPIIEGKQTHASEQADDLDATLEAEAKDARGRLEAMLQSTLSQSVSLKGVSSATLDQDLF